MILLKMKLYYARDKFPHRYISKFPTQILRQAQYDRRTSHSELVEECGLDCGILSRLMYILTKEKLFHFF